MGPVGHWGGLTPRVELRDGLVPQVSHCGGQVPSVSSVPRGRQVSSNVSGRTLGWVSTSGGSSSWSVTSPQSL